MSPRTPWVVLVLLLVVTSVASTGGVASIGPSANGAAYQVGDETPTNETIRHRDPREVSEAGDLAMVEGWLANAMASILAECTSGIDAGRPAVCDQLDRTYPEWVAHYDIIVEETGTLDGDQLVRAFDSSGDHQRSFRDDVTAFEDTYRDYQAARASGDTQRARRHARNLTQLATQIQGSGGALDTNYGVISERTRANLTDEAATVNRITDNKTAIAEDVEAETFVPTQLYADVEPSRFSFSDPTSVSGAITTENGTPIRNETVTFAIGAQTVETTTDDDGAFAFTYRPTLVAANTTELALEFRPALESVYQPANTTLSVTIDQVEPTLTVRNEPATVGYADPVTATGTVSVDGSAVFDVPIGVSVGGERLVTGQSTTNGTYELTGGLPATVEPGERTLEALLLVDGHALAPASATTSITVQSTDTTLTVDAAQTSGSAVRVTGRLVAVNGEPVPEQPVRIDVNDSTVHTITTDADGTYDTTITVPSSVLADAPNGTIRIGTAFSGTGTNLEPANASTTLTIEQASGPSTSGRSGLVDAVGASRLGDALSRLPWWGWVGLVLLGVLGAVGVVLGWRWFTRESTSEPAGETASSVPETQPQDGEQSPPARSRASLALARELFNNDATDDAVQHAYLVTRSRLETMGGAVGASTHWEFATHMRENGLTQDAVDALWTLTAAYEQATFAPEALTAATAGEAIEAAEMLTVTDE